MVGRAHENRVPVATAHRGRDTPRLAPGYDDQPLHRRLPHQRERAIEQHDTADRREQLVGGPEAPRRPCREQDRDAHAQISTWLPSSTTRLDGSRKNSIALSALRSIQANSLSRQSGMPDRDAGISVWRPRKKLVGHDLELQPMLAAERQRAPAGRAPP